MRDILLSLRPLIQRTIEEIDQSLLKLSLERQNLFVIVEAPTGYGKTIAAPLIFSKLNETGVVGSFLHVLPLRAIVKDFYLCKLIYSLAGDCSLKELCGDRTPVHDKIREALQRSKLGDKDIGYQMGEMLEPYGRKEPLFGTRYTVTTLDSFLYNLFRVPITELFKYKKHYAIPRARIYISGVFFDEAHVIFEEHEDLKLYTAFLEALEVLRDMRVPTIIASATLSKKVINEIYSKMMPDDYVIHVKLCRYEGDKNGKTICMYDEKFVEAMLSIKWCIKIISEDDIINIASQAVLQGKSVLVACDTVDKAMERYRKLIQLDRISDRVILLHGRLTRKDRDEAFNKLKILSTNGKGHVLVATSVVEAGVDISFNILITDMMRVTSFIQRCGRLCRNPNLCKDGIAEIYVVKSDLCQEDSLCFEILRYLEKNSDRFIPRLPFDIDNEYVGYKKLLDWHDEYFNEFLKRDKETQRSVIRMLGRALFVSSQTINEALKDTDYALVRTGILEIFVGSEEDNKLDPKESIPLSIDQVNKKIRESPECLKFIVLLDEHWSIIKKIPVEKIIDKGKDRTKIKLRSLYDLLSKATRDNTSLEAHGILLSTKCYKRGLGIITSRNRRDE